MSNRSRERGYTLPLYLYPTEDAAKQKTLADTSPWPPDEAHGNRVPNLNPGFVADMAQTLGLEFRPHRDLTGFRNLSGLESGLEFGPADIFHYIYAIFHSPTYRARYAEFLKLDFPRLPLTANAGLFWRLVELGGELVALHLMEHPKLARLVTSFPVPGENLVAPRGGYPKYTPPNPAQGVGGRVHINPTQYVEGVPPEVWDFQVGGYQVCHKWLKDRRGRQLSYDELTHYQRVVVALQETIRLMEEVDAAIPDWPLQ